MLDDWQARRSRIPRRTIRDGIPIMLVDEARRLRDDEMPAKPSPPP